MAQLAIKGHATRGKEVIEILEMLGSSELYPYNGDDDTAIYSINGLYIVDHDTAIYSTNGRYVVSHKPDDIKSSGFIVFTLEEFLEKFPYKLGDKVQYKGATSCGTVEVIERMRWVNTKVEYEIRPLCDYSHTELVTVGAEDLQPYKEQTMLERIVDITWESNGRYRLKVNDQFDIEADEGGYYIVPRKSKYPKTHVECFEILYPNKNFQTVAQPVKGHEGKKLFALQKLLVCRDAYWKIAGERMGLGKPWEPDYKNPDIDLYVIINIYNQAEKAKYGYGFQQCILVFPTEEMRDAFYENFKELIALAKEFL